MRFKDPSNSTSSPRRKWYWIISILLAAIVIIAIVIGAVISLKKKHRAEYETLRLVYARSADGYNVAAEKLDRLIDAMQAYPIEPLPERVASREALPEDYDGYIASHKDLETLKADIEQMPDEIRSLEDAYQALCQNGYDTIINDYNVMADAYNELAPKTAINYVKDMPAKIAALPSKTITIDDADAEALLLEDLARFSKQTDDVIQKYLILTQITAPEEAWVMERLRDVNCIKEVKAVTPSNDPNKLLGKEGGYTSCLYFSVTLFDPSDIPGTDVIEKGTDGGGAIEVYPDLETAKNRCAYLSQFDQTLLYSGSYAIIGTMVIRTSYNLTDQEQVDLTDAITKELTEIRQ